MSESLFESYTHGIEKILAPPLLPEPGSVSIAATGATGLEQAEMLLPDSIALESDLYQAWLSAATEHERSVKEIQMLGAAAADLAIAEHLISSVQDDNGSERVVMRGKATTNDRTLILQALNQPDALLKTATVPVYRAEGRRAQVLQHATYQCLSTIQEETVVGTSDAIVNLFAMDYAYLREAAELLGAEVSKQLREAALGVVRLAVDYVIAAISKVQAVLDHDREVEVRKAAYDFIDGLQDSALATAAVEKFLNTRGVYAEGKVWIRQFDGDEMRMLEAQETVLSIQGSFHGRAQIAEVVLRSLAVATFFPVITTPPWGPIIIASANLGILGYLLFSAQDHVDSGCVPVFERVSGVRCALIKYLDVPVSAINPSS